MEVLGSRIRMKLRKITKTPAERKALLEILAVTLEDRNNIEKRVQWRKKISQIVEQHVGDDAQ